jgi:DNA-binding transcriptional ArsR family regulator
MGNNKKSPEVRMMQALSHPIRISILMEMRRNGTLSANEHSKVIDEELNKVSYHFKQLLTAEFIYLVKQIPRRGALENIYALIPGTPVFVFLDFASAILATLGDEDGVEGAMRIQLMPIEVDDQGKEELKKFIEEAAAAGRRLGTESGERLKKEGKKGSRFDLGLGAFPRDVDDPPPASADEDEGFDAGQQRAA